MEYIKDKEDNKYFNLIINDYKRGYSINDIAKKYEMSISEVYKYIEPYISK
jgi:transposase